MHGLQEDVLLSFGDEDLALVPVHHYCSRSWDLVAHVRHASRMLSLRRPQYDTKVLHVNLR